MELENSEELYKWIAEGLRANKPVLIGWTDGRSTHFDILFTYTPIVNRNQLFGETLVGGIPLSMIFHGGISHTDLFVSIIGLGSFGFDINDIDTYPNYYDEKLSGNRIGKVTSEKLADLINGVKKYLKNL
jgi:hypothetical protein